MTTHRKWNYEGKVAFVTGAANGIGQATALAFAQEGADVVVVDLSEEGAQATVRMVEAEGVRALAVKCDVSKPDDVQAALAATIDKFGRLDFAFNNAGIEQALAYTAEIPDEAFERILRVNLGGVFYCMKYQIPIMLKNGGGSIVNTSSGAGVVGIRGQGAYCASKHGVIGLTKSAALEYGERWRAHQRCVSGHHRYADDRPLHARHRREPQADDRARADWPPWPTGGDRQYGPLAVF